MIFRQLFDSATSTFTYLLADEESREALLIDCVYEQHLRDLALLRELELKLVFTLETHVHADHVTGAWLMREAVGSKVVVPQRAGAEGADQTLDDRERLEFGSRSLLTRITPGHTDGCMTYVLDDESMAFTGDALLIRGAGRTDFQQGDPARLFASVREQIFSLPDRCQLWPGHDYSGRTSTSVWEERRHNPRLGDQVREVDFVGYMNNLGLPHPKKMADAVPANLVCGRPRDGSGAPKAPDWGPVIRTFAGVWQIEPEWVHGHANDVVVIDVRETEEIEASPIGRISGSTIVPLSRFRDALMDFDKESPAVIVCPAGARSAIAATIMEKAGFERVASMRGGILEWQSLGLPLEESACSEKN